MIFLSVTEVITLHSKLIAKTGGLDGLRDMSLLESAVTSVYSTFDSIELYPSIIEKSARLAFTLISNHAFIDGNKRIGILVMLMTLKLNEVNIMYSQKELIELGMSSASGLCQYKCILRWIEEHLV